MTSAPRAIPPSLNGWNAEYIDSQYAVYQRDPGAVSPDLRSFFQGFELGRVPGPGGIEAAAGGAASRFQSAVDDLISAYRQLGHLAARIDPFGRERPRPAELSLEFHGLGQGDLDREVDIVQLGVPGEITTLRQLIAHVEDTYCGSVGLEFTHIPGVEERDWFIKNFEGTRGPVTPRPEQRRAVLEQLTRAETFETFLGKRYGTEKRFSLEGGISLIPLLEQAIERSSDLGVEEIVLGMAHRGRLNVLNNIMGKSYEQIFTEFEDNWEAGFADGGGDVKYHRGYSGERVLSNGRRVHLAMSSNPSHLESVNAVVLGRCRAKQRLRNDTARERVVPVLIHGDAAIAGQGIVAECLNMSQLEGYTVGGSIHVVINNLIGFTTIPEDARSTTYCTDIAKFVDAPVFHVSGEDPEACVSVARLAAEYRQKFHKDVFIDMVCYRKYGHNEGDEQSFTQPLLAALIKQKQATLDVYAARLLELGVISAEESRQIGERLNAALDAAQTAAKLEPHDPTIDPGSAQWEGLKSEYSHEPVPTGAPMEAIQEVCEAMGRAPRGFRVNPKLTGLLEARAGLPASRKVSYAEGEMLAIGTLLLEGIAVRLSGQDSRRGTFTQRHAVLRDFETGEPYIPLNMMRGIGDPAGPDKQYGPDGRLLQARFCVYDSPLSEVSVLGFDYGYSLADPNMLVMWEAQFGDFANGAQVIIDQYIASSEIKWDRWSGLVLLLPHGYEGAGPEHSSARLERFLTLCADQNLEIVYPTTGAQIFHLLRRQMKRAFRKPLVVMTPKSLLRTPTSTIDELATGHFREVIDDPAFDGPDASDRKAVKRVVFCSGKVYFELAERRRVLSRRDVAIVRIEQLYPMHHAAIKALLARYPRNAEMVYAQEEPRNAGAFLFVADQFRTDLGIELKYMGREPSATPAVGSKKADKHQQEAVITAAIGPKPKDAKPAAEADKEAKPQTPARKDPRATRASA
ncbi:MAG: 2-oxoglutarate dehydrogenase E1 component [Phycisphaerales bacterium]|nr:2-oxoglutarate dehydrogenase E1 component [Phycisphaerales bacterium]